MRIILPLNLFVIGILLSFIKLFLDDLFPYSEYVFIIMLLFLSDFYIKKMKKTKLGEKRINKALGIFLCVAAIFFSFSIFPSLLNSLSLIRFSHEYSLIRRIS